MFTAIVILFFVALYGAIGLVFAILFVMRGIAAIDGAARGASWVVRLALIPGSVVLWPLLWKKWTAAQGAGHA